ncbi:hypothetical protein RN629_15305 [Sphingomonadaceae bacterium jetA1]|uniref:hypothetical protein n=1 Tax=Facivitalis istanbulensis TaxID=3075838 RepID=UPI00347EF176
MSEALHDVEAANAADTGAVIAAMPSSANDMIAPASFIPLTPPPVRSLIGTAYQMPYSLPITNN